MLKRIKGVVKESRNDKPIIRPKGRRVPAGERLSNQDRERANKRLRQLKLWRSELGEELEVEPSLLWPSSSLTRLARDPENLSQEFVSNEVRNWQSEEFGNKLGACIQDIVAKVS